MSLDGSKKSITNNTPVSPTLPRHSFSPSLSLTHSLSLSLSPSQRLVPLNKLVRFNDSYFFLVTRLPSFAPNAPLEKVAVNLVGSPRSLSLSFSPSLSPRFRPPRITRWYGVNDSWRVPPRFPKTEKGRSRPSTRGGLLSPREFLLSWSSVQLENARDRLLILFWNLLEVIRYATRIRFIGNKLCFRFESSRTLFEIDVSWRILYSYCGLLINWFLVLFYSHSFIF